MVVLDAAVLLEAGWDKLCHELWVTVIPQEEVRGIFRDTGFKDNPSK